MSRLTWNGTAEPVARDQILRRERGQGNVHFCCSADHEQNWQHYPVDSHSAICDDHIYLQQSSETHFNESRHLAEGTHVGVNDSTTVSSA